MKVHGCMNGMDEASEFGKRVCRNSAGERDVGAGAVRCTVDTRQNLSSKFSRHDGTLDVSNSRQALEDGLHSKLECQIEQCPWTLDSYVSAM